MRHLKMAKESKGYVAQFTTDSGALAKKILNYCDEQKIFYTVGATVTRDRTSWTIKFEEYKVAMDVLQKFIA